MENYKLVNADKLDFDLQSIANKIREKSETNEEFVFPSDFISKIDECVYLDFAIIGGTTKPTNPTENMIWINTDVEITNWVFSIDEPTEYSNGTMWFCTGMQSYVEFNMFKNNTTKMYPLFAQQYVNGIWVTKEAKSYQSEKWVDWFNGEIYKQGTLYENITGGWVVVNTSGGEGYMSTGNSIYLRYKSGATADQHSTAYTKNKISLERYKTLTMKIKVINVGANNMHANICLCSTNTQGYPTSNRIAYAATPQGATGTFTVTLDITNYNSEYYIAAWAMYCNADVIEIKLS